jgi:hypothetical protein
MSAFPSTIVSALVLALVMATVQRVKSEGVFYVNLYHRNVSEQNLELLSNRSYTTMSYLLQFLENCTATNAGAFAPGRERFLELEENEEDEAEATGEAQEMHRELSLSYCPDSCSRSGSTECRRIGCAYCGRCRRRRRGRGRKLLLVNASNVGSSGSPASAYPLGVRSP